LRTAMGSAKFVAVCLILMVCSADAINHHEIVQDSAQRLALMKVAKKFAQRFIGIPSKHFTPSLEEASDSTISNVVKRFQKEPDSRDPCEFEGQQNCKPTETFWSKWGQMIIFLSIVFVCILITGVAAFAVTNAMLTSRGNDTITFGTFFGGKVLAGSMVGMSSGLVFGFLDNFGLFFGMDLLDPLIQKFPMGTEPLVVAGYGNTFSDMVGAFMGVFVGKMIQEITDVRDYPIWSEAIGIFFGCLLGCFIPRGIHYLMGKKAGRVYSDEEIEMLVRMARGGDASTLKASDIDKLMSLFDTLDHTTDSDLKGAVRIENLRDIPQLKKAQGLLDLFDKADREGAGGGDGQLTREEFRKAITEAAGQNFVPKAIHARDHASYLQLFEKVDKKSASHPGEASISQLIKDPALAPLLPEFLLADLNGNSNGFVDRNEFLAALTASEIPRPSKEKYEEIFGKLQTDLDGDVTVDRLKAHHLFAPFFAKTKFKGSIPRDKFVFTMLSGGTESGGPGGGLEVSQRVDSSRGLGDDVSQPGVNIPHGRHSSVNTHVGTAVGGTRAGRSRGMSVVPVDLSPQGPGREDTVERDNVEGPRHTQTSGGRTNAPSRGSRAPLKALPPVRTVTRLEESDQ